MLRRVIYYIFQEPLDVSPTNYILLQSTRSTQYHDSVKLRFVRNVSIFPYHFPKVFSLSLMEQGTSSKGKMHLVLHHLCPHEVGRVCLSGLSGSIGKFHV